MRRDRRGGLSYLGFSAVLGSDVLGSEDVLGSPSVLVSLSSFLPPPRGTTQSSFFFFFVASALVVTAGLNCSGSFQAVSLPGAAPLSTYPARISMKAFSRSLVRYSRRAGPI